MVIGNCWLGKLLPSHQSPVTSPQSPVPSPQSPVPSPFKIQLPDHVL
ncbi:hypothetical protein [Sphaerospermopsis sp. FACHB-1194]|nr:hypothetical protein [Sphaerospermopsis sp. FACHB-1194]MBD2143693.1 hypothetical protein [Sphaerospermopsis sp. FACHB-1194]